MSMDLTKNKKYFEDIAHKIDILEHPELNNEVLVSDTYGEVDGNQEIITIEPSEDQPTQELLPNSIVPNVADIEEKLPSIDPDRIDGVISLYKELNKNYGLKFKAEEVTSIGNTFKAIINPTQKEIFEVYLREYIDRLRLACINQLANTVYSLIMKLTSEETIRSLTISERVALLDRLFEYMDRVNNMSTLLPKGDTRTELQEIAQRDESDEDGTGSTKKSERNRELESFVLGLLNGKQ